MKNKGVYRLGVVLSIVGLLLFAALVLWLTVGLGNASDMYDENRLKNVKQAVVNGAVMCYSIEGFYPEDISYLKEKYGLSYDESRYEVLYGYISSEKRPSVMVSEKKKISEVVG